MMVTRPFISGLALREVVNQRGEPDALTAHVRFWEGAVLN